MTGRWTAQWVSYSQHPDGDSGVFAFRRQIEFEATSGSAMLRISADQRFRLYVNGKLVGMGPHRGDLLNWRYSTFDIAPFLRQGSNWIVVLVWHFGRYAPMAQHSARQGLVVEVEGGSTPEGWQVAKIPGWGYDMLHSDVGPFYIDIGPGEVMDASALGWGCLEGDDAGLEWKTPNVVCDAVEKGGGGGGTPWMLVPSPLPEMLYRERNERPIDRASSRPVDPNRTVSPGAPLVLDYLELLTAYPRFTMSGPLGAKVTVTYAESFFAQDGKKGDRSEIEHKQMWGYQDVMLLDGDTRTFEPLWWRTFRYVRIECDVPITLEQVGVWETGYPYEVASSFTAEFTDQLWDVAVRTARLCAGETYFDCPYYEQLQYVGDTRVQALIGYYLAPDRRLQRSAIAQIADSVMPNGLTQSRYPSRQAQVIPPFSLFWVLMLYDQWLYDPEPPLGHHLNLASGVLGAWDRLLEASGENAYWTFTDWVPEWHWGEAPGRAKASVHRFTKWLADIAFSIMVGDTKRFRRIKQSIRTDTLVIDGLTYHKDDPVNTPSEHAEAIYRLCRSMVGASNRPWPTRRLCDAARCTYYFSYYKHLAMSSKNYLAELEPWREMLNDNLSTFAENPEPTRSDCHAWSAHPILGLMQIVAGVTSVAPGWGKARIAPNPGKLPAFEAVIAHPDGRMKVVFGQDKLQIESPVPFELDWQGKQGGFSPGIYTI